MKDRLVIFDTTLRDGEQSPGAAMTRDEKLRIARQLERLRVDVIEAGFAAASPGDAEAIRAIAEVIKDSTVCSLARANERDVRAAGEAIRPAARGRIHTFIATSPIHMEKKLRMQPDQVVEAAVAAVKQALQYTDDVEFSAEDAVRSEMDFLVRIFDAVIKAGAKTINVPDTVGYAVPALWGDRFRELIERVPGADKVIWSTHCHNDLGMAVANSLAAVQAGARQVECTINGLGERAGNASLEEVVMAVRTRPDVFAVETGIDASQIVACSKLVSTITGYPVQPNKAIVGANAFSHESGIHQDGVLKHRETYEIMRPEDVGLTETNIAMGKHSGRAALRTKMRDLGFELADNQLNDVFVRFKALADRKKEVYDDDLIALLTDSTANTDHDFLQVKWLRVICGSDGQEAELKMLVDGVEKSAKCAGDGPVDACFKAVQAIYPTQAELKIYQVHAVTEGTDAQATVSVRLAEDGRIVTGSAADTDTILASVKAYVGALNRLRVRSQKTAPDADVKSVSYKL